MKPMRRYLQFSLGTMFLAVTALCIWLGVQVKWMRDRQEARRILFNKLPSCMAFDGEYLGVQAPCPFDPSAKMASRQLASWSSTESPFPGNS